MKITKIEKNKFKINIEKKDNIDSESFKQLLNQARNSSIGTTINSKNKNMGH